MAKIEGWKKIGKVVVGTDERTGRLVKSADKWVSIEGREIEIGYMQNPKRNYKVDYALGIGKRIYGLFRTKREAVDAAVDFMKAHPRG